MANGISDLNYITATDLNHGKSSSCLKTVHDTNLDMLVIKQSTPYAVIVSYERYNELLNAYMQCGGTNDGRTENC